jgi:hypothetical protein
MATSAAGGVGFGAGECRTEPWQGHITTYVCFQVLPSAVALSMPFSEEFGAMLTIVILS